MNISGGLITGNEAKEIEIEVGKGVEADARNAAATWECSGLGATREVLLVFSDEIRGFPRCAAFLAEAPRLPIEDVREKVRELPEGSDCDAFGSSMDVSPDLELHVVVVRAVRCIR